MGKMIRHISIFAELAPKKLVSFEYTTTTDSCLLHKMRVSCSACADWPRALRKHKHAQRRTTLALTSTQVTRGRDAERLLTRERLLHTHSACLSTAARAYSSERYAPLQSAKRKQLISTASV